MGAQNIQNSRPIREICYLLNETCRHHGAVTLDIADLVNIANNAMLETTHQSTEYKYIRLKDDGVPHIAETTMKVVELVTSHLTYGWSPAELHFQYPHITMSQIYSALAYYWDHKADIDADIDRRLALAKQQQATAPPSIVAKLQP
ncbi:DUF433 domain-containing protein [Leptolyngbya sp. PCC 6406]|uniref:DUF433 domain-containing protein n=1 Tax=Leptolyngbya sp. PCC 6406 TaxID=1173264 RepID=UPI00031866A8|nr:DUF433 domain-containing protein [Leptolyngbya sp. PCC 6406]